MSGISLRSELSIPIILFILSKKHLSNFKARAKNPYLG